MLVLQFYLLQYYHRTRHLYQLLSKIGKIKETNEEDVCSKIDSIVNWASQKNLKDARFDGIFAFEIMCLNEKIDPKNSHSKQVLVPVKYLDPKYREEYTRVDAYYNDDNFKKDTCYQVAILIVYLKDMYNLKVSQLRLSKDNKAIITTIE